MSNTVDNRVLEMRFDNKQFESGVAQSMSTLDKLKQKLNLPGAAKGLEDVNKSVRGINMGPLGAGVEAVSAKFSALQVMGVTALANITNSAVNAGKRIASALTIDPIKTGFQEYETQINAVQTILANTSSKGTTLDQVNQALDELNLYADKTIYNFTEMTRNIGTFTAAGVDLDTSVSAIQGIANVAAVSGSTSQQASTAMYQLSQALAAGSVKLMDWNSVVNAGMGGQVFQDALKETSELLGTGAEAAIKAKGSFRESLQTGWITAEVLTETLKKFTTSGANEYVAKYTGLSKEAVEAALEEAKAQYGEAEAVDKAAEALANKSGKSKDEIAATLKMAQTAEDAATKVKTFSQLWDTLKEAAQSGWTQTWEILVGDFEEAKELLTSISDTVGNAINDMSTRRNDMLEGAMTSNWDKLVTKINEAGVSTDQFEEKLKNVLKDHGKDTDEIVKKYGSLEKAFQQGALSSDLLKEAVDGLSGSFTNLDKVQSGLKLGDTGEQVTEVQKALEGLGFKLDKFGADGIFGAETQEAIKAFQEANNLEITGIIDDATLAALKEASGTTGEIVKNVDDLINGIQEIGGRAHVIESFKNIFKALIDVIKPIQKAFREIFPPTTSEQLLSVLQKFHDFTETLKVSKTTAKQIHDTFAGLFSVLKIGVDAIVAVGKGIFGLLGNFKGLGGSILGVTSKFGNWLTSVKDSIEKNNVFGESVDKITGIIRSAIDKIKEFGSSLKESFKAPDVGGFFGFLQGVWKFVSGIGNGIAKAFGSLGKMLATALGKGDIFEAINSGAFAGIAIYIAKFVKSLSDGLDNAGGFLENITGILDDVRGCLTAYQEQIKADTLQKIAIAVGILAAALWVLSTIDGEDLLKALGGMAALMGGLVIVTKELLKLSGSFKGMATVLPMMIGLSVALLILSGAMKILSTIDGEDMLNSVLSIGILMSLLTLMAKIMDGENKAITKFAGQMILLSIAIGILAGVAKILATMSWEELGKAGAGIFGIVTILVGAAKIMDGEDKAITKFAGQMILLSIAIGILSGVAKILATMSWTELGKAGAGILGITVILVGAAKIMDSDSKAITKFAGQMVLMAAAIGIMAAIGKSLSSMSWTELGKAGAGLLGITIILVAAAKTLSKSKGSMLKAGAGMILMSVSMGIMAIALKKLSALSLDEILKGLIAMAGAFVIVGIAGLALQPIIGPILDLAAAFALFGIATLGIGVGVMAIAAGFTALAGAGAAGATAFVAALGVIVTGVLELIPTIARIIGEGIVEIAKIIGEYAPQLAESFYKLLLGVMNSLATYAPQITDALFTFLIGVINSLANHMPEFITAFVNLIGSIFKGLVDAFSSTDTDQLLKGMVLVGLTAGIMYLLSGVVGLIPGAMAGLVGVGLIIAEMIAVIAAIGYVIDTFPKIEEFLDVGLPLLEKLAGSLGKMIGNFIGNIAEGITDSLPAIADNITQMMEKLAVASDKASGIKTGSFDGVKDLASVMGSIGWTSIGTTISDFLTIGGTSMEKFTKDGVAFFNGMKEVCAASQGITVSENFGSVVDAASQLATLQSSLEGIGGVISWFKGRDDLGTFGENIGVFATAIGTLKTSMGEDGITESTITSITNTGDALIALQKALPTESWFDGKMNLSDFSEYMTDFGTAMGTLSTNVGTLDQAKIDLAMSTATRIRNFLGSLTDVDATGLADFAGVGIGDGYVINLGQAIGGFGDAVGTIDVTKVNTAVSTATRIRSFISSLTGLDATGIENFKIESIGKAMKGYGKAVDGLDPGKVSSSVTSATRLRTFISSLAGLDSAGVSNFKPGPIGTAMKSYSANVSDINGSAIDSSIKAATKIKNFITSLNGFSSSGVGAFKTAVSSLAETNIEGITKSFSGASSRLSSSGTDMMESLAGGIKSNTSAVTQSTISIVNKVLSDIKAKAGEFNKAGSTLMTNFVKGINAQSGAARSAGSSVASAAVGGTSGYYSSFHSMGSYVASGFVSGIRSKIWSAANAAAEMAAAAERAARERLNINSPSKVFRAIGSGIPEGFVQGIGMMGSAVKQAVYGMGDTAIASMNKSMSRLGDMLSSDIDYQPTIRPVVDLSDVQAGASAISGLFSNQTVGLNANVRAASVAMGSIQNGTVNDVISSLDKLRKDLGNVGNTTYSINGITYDDGSNIANAVRAITREARIQRRI